MKLSDKWFQDFVRESNRIEGINREPTHGEIEVHQVFLNLDRVSISDLESFVQMCAGTSLRLQPGMDVYVGDHRPPPGGPGIGYSLGDLLHRATRGPAIGATPYALHVEYETLHPFMDGNGRSGRVLWAWMMNRLDDRLLRFGFLHAWYYQSLSAGRR